MTEQVRELAANIMAAMRRARFPKEDAAEAHDEFEALTLTPMLLATVREAMIDDAWLRLRDQHGENDKGMIALTKQDLLTAMRATTPIAPDQDTGASVPDQALAVPVEPVARLDPSGFDPSRVANIANRLGALERRAVLHREGGSEACMSWGTAASLYEKGLTERNARFLRLTALGQRVRAALQIEDIAHD